MPTSGAVSKAPIGTAWCVAAVPAWISTKPQRLFDDASWQVGQPLILEKPLWIEIPGAGAGSAASNCGASARRSSYCTWALTPAPCFNPAREVGEKYGKCAKINDPANSVGWEKCAVFHANTMRVKDAKKAAKLPGGIDHAAVGRGRDIPSPAERRGRGTFSFGGTYPARQ